MNPYLGKKYGKTKISSYILMVICAIMAAAAISVLLNDIKAGKEMMDLAAASLLTALFVIPIIRILSNMIYCRKAQRIASYLGTYDEVSISFEKLEKEVGKGSARQAQKLLQKEYLQNMKADQETARMILTAPSLHVENQIFQTRICPYCGAEIRTVKGRVTTCEFCGQKI